MSGTTKWDPWLYAIYTDKVLTGLSFKSRCLRMQDEQVQKIVVSYTDNFVGIVKAVYALYFFCFFLFLLIYLHARSAWRLTNEIASRLTTTDDSRR